MDKFFQKITTIYMWVTQRIPLRVIHFVICFCATFISWELSLGLTLGRESCSFESVDKIKDSLGDLLSDAIGILLALLILRII